MCISIRCPTAPAMKVDVDRTLAEEMGMSQRDVANSVLVTLELQRDDGAEFLVESAKRGELSTAGADTAVPCRTRCRS